ncbi:MAG: hypothetical protein E7165_02925 [Firmicutes bacterium]|nr:hypothetical protein [Bacillota bacterium]
MGKTVKTKTGTVKVDGDLSKFEKVKLTVKKNGGKIVAGTVAVLVMVGAVGINHYNKYKNNNVGSSNNNNNNDTQDTTPDTSVSDTVKEEEYSRDLLNTRVQNFTKEINAKGISLTEEEVYEFAAFMNIDTIMSEDPELAQALFENKSGEEVLTDVGHIIGKLMTASMTSNYQDTTNLSTLIVGNDSDKAVMTRLEGYRDNLTSMRAEENGEHRVEFATKEEEEKFNEIMVDIIKFYSMNVDGFEINGQNSVIQEMGDGTRFALVLVMNEIALGNKNLLTEEQYKGFQDLMSNEATVSNLITKINGCKSIQKTK